jgi:hypothetical protein
LVSAAVLGKLACLGFGVDILMTRDIRMAPAGCARKFNLWPGRVQRLRTPFDKGRPYKAAGSSKASRITCPNIVVSGLVSA